MVKRSILLSMLAIICSLIIPGCIPEATTRSSVQGTLSQSPPPTSDSTSLNAQPIYQQAPAAINTGSDGKIIHVNLVKFTGNVSSADTTVTVNNIPATVNKDGNYYVYLDLTPGTNNIEIKTSQGSDIQTKTIAVTFQPPLTVNLNWPEDIKTPLTITGFVSNPKATIKDKDGGMQLNVAGDGSFAFRPSGRFIEVIATLDDEMDTDSLPLNKSSNGVYMAVPTPAIPLFASLSMDKYSVDLIRGEMAAINFTYNVRKDMVQGPTKARFTLFRVEPSDSMSSPEETNHLPMIPGLGITIEPSAFAIYPNIDYHLAITIKPSGDIAPGIYQFTCINWVNDKFWASRDFKVNIKP